MTASSRSNEGDQANSSNVQVRSCKVSVDVRRVLGPCGPIVTHSRLVLVWHPLIWVTSRRLDGPGAGLDATAGPSASSSVLPGRRGESRVRMNVVPVW